MNTQQTNLRVAQILRDAISFGTLEQCIEASMLCHRLEDQGIELSRVEDRLWLHLTQKIEALKESANDELYC